MKLIYIPIEIKARELTSKLLFISENINENFVYFIGDKKSSIRATSLLGEGIYFYKSINYNDTNHILRIKNKGNAYISLDEEGGATQSNTSSFQSYLNYRSNLKNVSLVNKIFTWGNFDYKGWNKKYKNHTNKIIKTGSPRFDIWRKEIYSKIFKDEILHLKKYSPFFFIPSTFISSYSWLQKEISNEKKMKRNNNKLTYGYLKKRIKARKDSHKNFLAFVNLIKKLTKDFPKYKILIKPHPTENVLDWKKKFKEKKYSNVLIDNKYDLTAYIAASNCVIFSESTAGIQSIIMGKKAISYNLKNNVTFRNFANKCAPQTSNYDFLLKYLNENYNYEKLKYKKKIKDRFYITKKTSSKIIMQNIKKIKMKPVNFRVFNFKVNFFGSYFLIKDNLKFFLMRVNQIIFKTKPKIESRFSYSLKMPGGIKRDEIEQIFKNLKIDKKIKIKNFGKDGYIIYKDIDQKKYY
ncbi:surface carbohydrate biosynthesis protein [Candidatus Pelagibacter sp. HIMB1709]|uniref:surface carbohydrate biosynthesis protein n=1 Tax=Candidatus Pelagibacter sp. HIMB1709 TaxID=3413367 RepID=UPI003F84E081